MENTENIIVESEVQKTVPQKEKTRRIGTITMGLALIIVGVSILISMFNPNFNMVLVAKLSPLILIALGLEIIASTFIFKGEKLKYDFLSGFVCFMLILTSIGLAIIPKLYNDYIKYYGPERNALNSRLVEELEDSVYMVLKNNSDIIDIDASCAVNASEFDKNMTISDLKSEDYVSFNIMLDRSFESKREFAEASEKIMKAVSTLNISIDHFRINTGDSRDFWYELGVDGNIGMNATAEKLERSVEFRDLRPQEPDYEYNDGIDMAPYNPDAPDAPDVTIAVPDAPEAPEAPVVTEMTAVTTRIAPKVQEEAQERYEHEKNKAFDNSDHDVEEPIVTGKSETGITVPSFPEYNTKVTVEPITVPKVPKIQ